MESAATMQLFDGGDANASGDGSVNDTPGLDLDADDLAEATVPR